MLTKLIEACDGSKFNWGKFMVQAFTPEEWQYRSEVDGRPLLGGRGWGPEHLMVFDLQIGEGALFKVTPHGLARSDLEKHKVLVCPLFEPFLKWLYQQDVSDLEKLPDLVNLGDVPTAMFGYRRDGTGLK